ncbi:hypothetical protein V6N11_027214 [Hibiscus sabdariffa]|uniref:Uncharacterized protein n=1 Tax=Hibiscus sabdariffa TaxID=183260 RepID=A0ABR2PG91_9ROSI
MAKIALFIVLVSMIMIHSAQVVVSDNEPSAAPIADVVAVAGPVSGSESSPALAPAPAPTPETTTKDKALIVLERKKRDKAFKKFKPDKKSLELSGRAMGTVWSCIYYHQQRAHIQIETDWTFHIDEIIDVRVDDVIFQVRITEIEEAIGPKCDYCCEVIVDSDSGKPDNSNTKVESLDNDSFNRQHIHSTGTFVPNSVKSASVKNDLLEVNKRDDLRAMTSMSDMLEENIGLVNRDEVYHCSFSDFAEAYGLRVGGNDLDLGPIVHEGVVESKGVVSPITSGPICDLPRVNAAETIELNGRQRKIRLVSDVLMNNTTLFDKVAQRIGEEKTFGA